MIIRRIREQLKRGDSEERSRPSEEVGFEGIDAPILVMISRGKGIRERGKFV